MPNEERHPDHPWIFFLLVIAILGVLGIFGVYLYETIRENGEEEVVAPVMEEEIPAEAEEPAEEEKEPVVQHFEGGEVFPSFDYPENWHLYSNIAPGDLYLALSPSPIRRYEATDAPLAPIIVYKLREDEAILAPFEDTSFFDNFKKSEKMIDGKTAQFFEGTYNQNALRPGTDFVTVYVGGFGITYQSGDKEAVERAGLTLLLSTINFD